jgi:hypothetical protein
MFVTACAPVPHPAPEATPGRFYANRDYGSESQFNPLSELLNEGFDVLRERNEDRKVFSRDYAGSFHNVMESVLHADRTYREYGVGKAVRNEWLPLTARDDYGGGAWIANYQYHALGSGMVSVRMEEWFAQHGSSHPRAAAITAMMAAHLLNEVVENRGSTRPNEDATTDLLIFDPLGILVWRIDAVQRFFSGPLEFTNWPGQPSIDVNSGTLQNASQQFMLRGRIPGTQRWRLMYDIGLSHLLGVSYVRPNGGAWSAAIGPYVVTNPIVDTLRGARTATFRMNGGLFYDREGSLLFSALYAWHSEVAKLNVNVFPGVLRIGRLSPGVWLQTPERGGVRIGVVSRLGLGLGVGPER